LLDSWFRLPSPPAAQQVRKATKCALSPDPQPSCFEEPFVSLPSGLCTISMIFSWSSSVPTALVCLFPILVQGQVGCGTDSNPYCAGVNAFSGLCCAYPNVCYYAGRNGAVGCCLAGQVCLNNDAQSVAPAGGVTTIYTTPEHQSNQYTTITSTVQGTSTTTVPGWTTQPNTVTVIETEQVPPAVVVVTANQAPKTAVVVAESQPVTEVVVVTTEQAPVVVTVTSDPAAAAVATVSGVLIGSASRSSRICLWAMSMMISTLVWHNV